MTVAPAQGSMTAKRILRSLLAVVAGLALISGVVEAIEFGLVTLVNGGPTMDSELYYEIRNRPWFLAVKLGYNTAAAVGAGFLAAAIAGRAYVAHGLALGLVQTLAFGWALTQPDLSRWTPGWVWAALIVSTFAGIVLGARLRAAQA